MSAHVFSKQRCESQRCAGVLLERLMSFIFATCVEECHLARGSGLIYTGDVSSKCGWALSLISTLLCIHSETILTPTLVFFMAIAALIVWAFD